MERQHDEETGKDLSRTLRDVQPANDEAAVGLSKQARAGGHTGAGTHRAAASRGP